MIVNDRKTVPLRTKSGLTIRKPTQFVQHARVNSPLF